jgi:hypothetical protein
MTEPTDTPVNAPFPRPTVMEQIKGFVGDLARPIAIIGTTYGFNVALIKAADKIGPDATAAAIFITAAGGILATLYGAKAWEVIQGGKHAANVEIAKATTATGEAQP